MPTDKSALLQAALAENALLLATRFRVCPCVSRPAEPFRYTASVHCVSCRPQNHRLTTFTRRTHRLTKDRPARHTHALKNKTERASGAFCVPSNQVPKQAAAGGQGPRQWQLPCNHHREGRSAQRWRPRPARRSAPKRRSCWKPGRGPSPRWCSSSKPMVTIFAVESAPACRSRRPHQPAHLPQNI